MLRTSVSRICQVAALALIVSCGGDDEDGAGGGRGGGRRGGGQEGGGAAIPVKAEVVQIGEISSYIQTHARLEAERWVSVIARTQGMVEELLVEEGDRVREGAVLVRLDKVQLSLNLKQARVALDDARATHTRRKALYERQMVSEEEYEGARNQLENTEVALEEARLNLAYTDIKAPISGTVMLRRIELGDLVRSNDEVFAVADLEPLLTKIRIPEKRMSQVRAGQEARVDIDALPDRSFGARVRMINPGVDPQSGTVKVTLEVPSLEGLLKPGMFTTVRIITDIHRHALIIPKKALVLETDEDDVFVVEAGSAGQVRANRVRVELGYVDGNRVEVLSGLRPGASVITVGQEGLKDGAHVRLAGTGLVDSAAVAEAAAAAPAGEGRAWSGGGGRGGGGSGEMPDSATVIARMKERGMSDSAAVARYKTMKERRSQR
jgi:membrane fusion protein (multidrug efflux system)